MIDALEGAAPVRAVRDVLAEGPRCWLVGGVVRDALLDRPVGDVDIAVDGDPRQAANTVARALGGPAFALSEAFGSWRALDRDRRVSYDVSALQGASIEEDLARRDFSINAIAVPLQGGEAIDPHGGRADLAQRTLRVLGASAYQEDPLRALRLVRLVSELGFAPDPETERLTAAAAPRLVEVSPERVFAELQRMVAAPGVLAGIDLGARLGVLGAVLPELTALTGIEQSRFHHLDVYRHTLEVLERLMEVEADLERFFGELAEPVADVLAQPLAGELTRGQALRFGALLHDIAKPQTRGAREDGRVTFIGHDVAGQELSRAMLTRLRTSERLRAYVGALTRHHLALGFMVHRMPLEAGDVYGYLDRVEPVEVEVTLLSCADRMATRGEGQEPWIDTHLELARELMGPALRWRAAGPPGVPIRGDELAGELGIDVGPRIGELLAQLRRAVYTGEVSNRSQAVAFADRAIRHN